MSTKEQAGAYTPYQNNRFEISADPYSQARYKSICEASSSLKDRFPHFAGFTLFGSLSKGKVLDKFFPVE